MPANSKEAKEDLNAGFNTPIWFWASKDKEQADPSLGEMPASDPNKLPPDDRAVVDLIVDNPGMSASTFYNLMKSKGFKIAAPDDAKDLASQSSAGDSKQEADGTGGGLGQLTRAGVKDDRSKSEKSKPVESKKRSPKSGLTRRGVATKTRESTVGQSTAARAPLRHSIQDNFLSFKFLEKAKSDSLTGPTKFKVVLIQEGLGNFKDAFYYSRAALESAIPVFEGKKIYADHPDALEEQTRPERSVKDVLGHFENVHIEEGDDGQAQLVGDLQTMDSDPYKWARALMTHAIQFSEKYPDKDFIGLSINASGDAEEKKMTDLLEGGTVPQSAIPKLKQALEQGVETVRFVSSIKDAVSCDLVTEAGAGGRFLAMLEKEKNRMGKQDKDVQEAEEKDMESKEAGDDAEGGSDDQGGDDADQDKHLIKKMIKKHLGDSGDSEEAMESAMEAYEHMTKSEGMKGEEAAKHAAVATKCAMKMSKKKEAGKGDDADKQESGAKVSDKGIDYAEGEDKSEKNKESRVAKLAGRVAFLESEIKKGSLEKHLDAKLRESKLPRQITDKLRKSLGVLKSEGQINTHIDNFLEGYRVGSEASGESLSFLSTEKRPLRGSESGDGFGDCAGE